MLQLRPIPQQNTVWLKEVMQIVRGNDESARDEAKLVLAEYEKLRVEAVEVLENINKGIALARQLAGNEEVTRAEVNELLERMQSLSDSLG